MKVPVSSLVFSLAILPGASAQLSEAPPEDRALLLQQAGDLFKALVPAVENVSSGAVEVRVWRKRVGFGTVVAAGKVLTKWSEVRRDVRSLSCRTGDGKWLPAVVSGVYPDADLAVMEVEGLKAGPVKFADERTLKLGSFLALSRPDGEAAAMGVVSVLSRSLRSSDRAFLGVVMDLEFEGPGVLVRRVEPKTGASSSGLRAGDVIMRVMDQEVNGSFELGTLLQRLEPGQKVEISFKRGEKQEVVDVELGGRPRTPRIPYSRMEQMNSMGGHRYNDVKDGFRNVIQSDMQLDPEDCGAPVVDLDGRAIGIAIARAGRIKSFIVPASEIKSLLAIEPVEPQLQPRNSAARMREREFEEGDENPFEVMRRKMEEMRRLMEEIEGKGK
ncbi:MAG: PDZ domain-containing protein [Roseibacillus sp.]|nr:PDZ domain-containing protein [Roseibacillus sp.]